MQKARNLPPKFTDEDMVTKGTQINPREVPENAGADRAEPVDSKYSRAVGNPVVATDTADADDTDDERIAYSLSGAGAKYFTIDSAGDDR